MLRSEEHTSELQSHSHLVCSDRKSTRLNSSHTLISYAVFCLKKKKKQNTTQTTLSPMLSTRHCHRFRHISRHVPFVDVCFVPYFFSFFVFFFIFFFFNDTATTEIYTLSLHDALPI